MSDVYAHKAALAALSPEELTALKAPADRPALLRLAGHAGLLCVTGLAVWWAPDWPLLILAMLAHGIVLSFLFSLEHEAIHGTAFRTPWLNAAAAEAAGFLLLLPPRHFRYFHLAHHRHTQDPDHDPELSAPRPQGWPRYLWHLTGIDYWKYALSGLVRQAFGRDPGSFVPANGRRKVVREARAHLAAVTLLAGASIAYGWTWPLTLWVLPALLGQPFLRMFLLAEHAGCPMVADMLENSRTTFANGFVQFLTWNMPHHSAHHALPVVPFHRLPELTSKLETRLRSTASGYPEAHRQIRASWRARA